MTFLGLEPAHDEGSLLEQLTKLKAQLNDAESALAVQCEMTARYKEAADAKQRYRQSGAAAKALQEAEQARNENACALADAVKSRDAAEKQAEIYRQETHRWSAAYRAEKEQREVAEHSLTRHRNFVFDALRSVVHKIEICGASAELTNAVTAAGDLACAVGSVDVDYGPGYRELVLDAIRKQNERDGVPFRPERYDGTASYGGPTDTQRLSIAQAQRWDIQHIGDRCFVRCASGRRLDGGSLREALDKTIAVTPTDVLHDILKEVAR